MQQGYHDHVYRPPTDNPFSWTFGAASVVLPVDVQKAKRRARIDDDNYDDDVRDWICDAVEYIERTWDTNLINRTAVLAYDRWPCGSLINPWASILIPRWPVASVQSVQYYDPSGTLQTWASNQYTVDLAMKPVRIQPAYGIPYPTIRCQQGAVIVNLTLGYGTSGASVPSIIKQAIYLYVTHANEQRGDQYTEDKKVQLGIDALLTAASWGSVL